jgi:acetyl-CoA carboxylase biotin carboxylase subunit
MGKINKILIANRGEIAVRIIRTAQKMGIRTVAVFSDSDKDALHVKMADESAYIGKSPSSESYLNADKILEVCRKMHVDAIHPGYGFLSENAVFAQKVIDAGIIFIGPMPKAIKMMGDKLMAKDAVKAYDIPMVPGTPDAISDETDALSISKKIGFPVLIKAAAGGGGKGMRIVEHAGEFFEQLERAVSEAKSAFGNGAVFIEKYVTSPRHVEIQVMADMHGNIVYLFERECSVQRRHQKVVEEAPSAILTPELRAEMGRCAVDVARACHYVGAGTVEFLLDADKNFYFLEMNTRLQVEHPVTEMITGLDLVEEQIKVAQGERLRFAQEDLHINGHAIEMRVYAEDPMNNFLPDIGKLAKYRPPLGNFVRCDSGYSEGMEIPIYYDPMLAKLVVHGVNREEAIEKMIEAIENFRIVGVETTLPFGRFVMKHEAFRSGRYDTHFVAKYFKPELLLSEAEIELAAILAAGQMLKVLNQTPEKFIHKQVSPWVLNRKS